MSAETALYQYWRTSESLCQLVPSMSVFVAISLNATCPRLQIHSGPAKVLLPTSHLQSPQSLQIRLELHHNSFSEGVETASGIALLLDRVWIKISSSQKMMLRFTGSRWRCESENHWVFDSEFNVLVY